MSAGPQLYPAADAKSQWFGGAFSASPIVPRKLVLHTTETGTWPGYKGGASAPHITYWPGHGFRQHYRIDRSARALRNPPGGVQTNTDDAVQIELVGTCDPVAHRKHPDRVYWPEASDAILAELAHFVAWLGKEWGLRLTATPRPLLAYPASYGASPARMGFTEWDNFRGVCGHQNVPENVHGDPGNLPIAKLLRLANATTTTTPIPQPSKEDDMTVAEFKTAIVEVLTSVPIVTNPLSKTKLTVTGGLFHSVRQGYRNQAALGVALAAIADLQAAAGRDTGAILAAINALEPDEAEAPEAAEAVA